MSRRLPHPFRVLRSREHITFKIDPVADAAGGAFLAIDGDHTAIVISPELGRRQRSDALAHELAHEEIGVVVPPATEATMQKAEHQAESAVTEWLVPREELYRFVLARSEVEPVTAFVVAEHFDCTETRAARALARLNAELLEQEMARALRSSNLASNRQVLEGDHGRDG